MVYIVNNTYRTIRVLRIHRCVSVCVWTVNNNIISCRVIIFNFIESRQCGKVVQGGRRPSAVATTVFVSGGFGRRGYYLDGMREWQGRQFGGFFSAPLRPRQRAEHQQLSGRRGLFAGILTAISVRRQARVLVRLILSGFPSAVVPHIRVGSWITTETTFYELGILLLLFRL